MKRKKHQSKFKTSKVAAWASKDAWPCPKNNKNLTWRGCWLINRFLPGRFYGGYDCWTCPNLLNQRRQAHQHKWEVLIGLIASLVIFLCLLGVIIFAWLRGAYL